MNFGRNVSPNVRAAIFSPTPPMLGSAAATPPETNAAGALPVSARVWAPNRPPVAAAPINGIAALPPDKAVAAITGTVCVNVLGKLRPILAPISSPFSPPNIPPICRPIGSDVTEPIGSKKFLSAAVDHRRHQLSLRPSLYSVELV